jgi:hypothetical protein
MAGDPDYIDPIWATGQSDAIAPTGLTIPTGSGIPALSGKVLFCNWSYGNLIAIELDASDPDIVVDEDMLPVKCNLDVIEGPDGAVQQTIETTMTSSEDQTVLPDRPLEPTRVYDVIYDHLTI